MCLACQLASAILSLLTLLPDLPCCTQLNLSRNQIGAEGAKPLADALRVCPSSLTSLNLASNNIGGETGYVKATEVQGSSFEKGNTVIYKGQEMIISMGKDSDGEIKMIDLSGIKAIADALRANASVTSVNVLSNQLDVDSADLLLKVKAEKPNLRTLCGLTHEETELNLWNRSLGPGDAKLLAAEILVMASLTQLDVGMNSLGEQGKAVLRNAVEGRSGFELKL